MTTRPSQLSLTAAHRAMMRALAQPMRLLAKRTGLTAKLSIRLHTAAVPLLVSEPPLSVFVSGVVGARFHIALGASGACLLSELPDARIQSILGRAPRHVWNLQTPAEVWDRILQYRVNDLCVDLGQFHPNARAICTGLRDADGRLLAALALMGFAHDLNGSCIDQYAAALLRTARLARKHLSARATGSRG